MIEAADTPPLLHQPKVIAHEMANALTAIHGCLQFCHELIVDMPPTDPIRRSELLELLELAIDRADHASDYLHSIRSDVTPSASGEAYDAIEVVRACVRQERLRALERDVPVEEDVDADHVWLRGSSFSLYHILTNLVCNAVAVSKPRQPVRVHVSKVAERLRITVSDSGQGIPPEHLERVFDQGFTTECAPGGTGIGLAVVRELTNNVLGGTVTLCSTVGRGTEFTVTLPIPVAESADN